MTKAGEIAHCSSMTDCGRMRQSKNSAPHVPWYAYNLNREALFFYILISKTQLNVNGLKPLGRLNTNCGGSQDNE
jgi:hypothetical protein